MLAERDTIQTAMDALMADQRIAAVVRPTANTYQNDFTALPQFKVPDRSTGTDFLKLYMQVDRTTYFYCWDKTGRITRQDEGAKPGCP